MEQRVLAEDVALLLAWAEAQDDPALEAAAQTLAGLDLWLLLADGDRGVELLASAAISAQAPPAARLFAALGASPQELDRSLAACLDDPAVALALGCSLLLDRSDPERARGALARVALDPGELGPVAGRLLEFALLATEALDELVELLSHRPPPGFASPEQRRAEALRRASRPEARPALAALAREARDSYAWVRLEELLQDQGDAPGLAELYRLTLQATITPQERSLLLLRLGQLLEERLEDPQGAAAAYAAAEGGRLSAAILARRTVLHRRKGEWEALAECLREEAAQADDPRRGAALELVAGRTLLERVGDPFEAARCFEHAASVDPGNARALEFWAEALLLAGDVESLASLHPEPWAALLRRSAGELSGLHPALQASAALQIGDPRGMALALRRWALVEQSPAARAALLTVAGQLEPDRARARQDLAAALVALPTFLPALLAGARLLTAEGRLRQAVEALTRAADAAGPGPVRLRLQMDAADLGDGIGDPGVLEPLYDSAAAALFARPSSAIERGALLAVLADGGDWARHTPALLEAAARRGLLAGLAPTLLDLVEAGTGPVSSAALRALNGLDLPPAALERLATLLERRGNWGPLVEFLERRARATSEPQQRSVLFERAAQVAELRLEDGELARRLRIETPAESLGVAPPLAVHPAEEDPEALVAQALEEGDWEREVGLLLAAAHRFSQRGQRERAESCFQDVLAKDASNLRALGGLAELARQAGDWAGARAWLDQLSEPEGDPTARRDVLLLRARLALQQPGHEADALREFEACLALDPGCVEAFEALLRLYREAGDDEALRDLYLQRLEAPGLGEEQSLRLLQALADLCQGPLERPDRAISYLKRALSLRPGDVGLLRRLAETALRAELWRERVEALESLARQVQDPGERSELYLELAEIYRDRLGGGGVVLENTMVAFVCDNTNRRAFEALEELYVSERRWREVVGIYDVALAAARAGGPYDEGRLLRSKGLVLAQHKGAPREASEVLLEALTRDPDDAEVAEALDGVVAQLGDGVARLRMLEILAAAKEGPEQVELLLAAARSAAGLPEGRARAEAILRRAEALSLGDDRRALLALDALLAEGERWEELAELHRRVALRSEDPGRRREHLQRAALVLEQRCGDASRAVAIYLQMLELDPRDGATLRALARLYESSQRWDELLAISRRQLEGLESAEERGLVRFRIGSILETHRRDEAGAQESYRAALQDDPRCFPALHGLRDLFLRRHDWVQAAQTLETEAGLWQDPRDRAAVLVRLGDLLLQRLRDVARATAAYRRALRTAPGFPAAARALLPLLVDAEAWEEAGPLARLVSRLAASDTEPAERSLALTLRGLVALRRNELRESAGALRLALQAQAGQPRALEILYELLRQPDAQQLDEELLGGLLELVQRSPEAERSLPWLPLLRGRYAEAQRRVDDALRQYRLAWLSLPPRLDTCAPLVRLLAGLRRWTEAVEVLESLAQRAERRDDRLRATLHAGQLLLDRRQDAEAALPRFRRVAAELGRLRRSEQEQSYGGEDERLYRDALYAGAQAAYLAHHWEEGLRALGELVELEEDDPREVHGPGSLGRYLYLLGRVLRDGQARRDEAAAVFYRAVEEGPGHADAVLALARQFWVEGDLDDLDDLLDSQIPLADASSFEEGLRLRAMKAETLLRRGRPAEAYGCLEQAFALPASQPGVLRLGLANLAAAQGEPRRCEQELFLALWAGAPPVEVLGRLATAFARRSDELRRGWARDLRVALDPQRPLPEPKALEGPLPSLRPADASAVLERVLHPGFGLAEVAAAHAAAGPAVPALSPEELPRQALGAGSQPAFEQALAAVAASFGVAVPPVALCEGAERAVAWDAGTLCVPQALLGEIGARGWVFLLAGPLWLGAAGLALALQPSRERSTQALADLVARAGGALPEVARLERTLELSAHRLGIVLAEAPAEAWAALLRVQQPGAPLDGEVAIDLVHYALCEDHLHARRLLGLSG